MMRFEHHEKDIHVLYRHIVESEKRNSLIVEDVLNAIKNSRSPLILSERSDHVLLLESMISLKVQHTIVLKGGMGKKQREALDEKLKSIPESEPRVIIATGRYIGEGFDDSRLDTLFLAMPISWKGTLQQYVGRLHRFHEGKEEVQVYDYVDADSSIFASMFRKRQRGYKSMGYEIADPDQSDLKL